MTRWFLQQNILTQFSLPRTIDDAKPRQRGLDQARLGLKGRHKPATPPSTPKVNAEEATDSGIERLEATVAGLAAAINSLASMF